MMAVSRLALAQRGITLANTALVGPFLSPGSLAPAERLRLIDGIERVLEGVYTHLPLKRARYGFDPVQRLRILRSQIRELSDDAFHLELADVITRLRDAHTMYTGPKSLESKVAALPVPGGDDRLGECAHLRGHQGRAQASTPRSSRASCWSTGTAFRSIARCCATPTRNSADGLTASAPGRCRA
jgi:hypothetical protein